MLNGVQSNATLGYKVMLSGVQSNVTLGYRVMLNGVLSNVEYVCMASEIGSMVM